MTALPKKKKYTSAEYLTLEEESEYRSEFDDGTITAMAGGTLNHAQITANLGRRVGNNISDECTVLTTDVKVRVEDYRKFYYPDVLVIYGEPMLYQKRSDTIINPVLIVEVLSDITEARDRGEKMLAYRTLESLQEYVLVSQNKTIVEQFMKTADGNWMHKATIGLKSAVRFESINVELTLDEIYQRIEL